jgi:glutaminyl-peptide cyclotransferase
VGGLVLAAMLARSRSGPPAAPGLAGAAPKAVSAGPATPGAPTPGSSAGTAGGPGGAAAPGPPAGAGAERAAEHLRVKVLSVRPHDPTAYTQGLVWDHGTFYESAGLYGRSSLRQVEPRTGEVLRRVDLAPGFFAEGLALVGNRLLQLTWKEGVAFQYDARTFERTGELHYEGEGWGLCDDGRRLVMSDGSDHLGFRDRRTFALLGGVDVRLDGRPATQLNELECVDGAIYANVWRTDEILRIDPASGRVTAVIDAGGLLDAAALEQADVLNGIAYDPEKKTFFITGKLWPKMFEVVFVGGSPR